jgi:hypothetical protein
VDEHQAALRAAALALCARIVARGKPLPVSKATVEVDGHEVHIVIVKKADKPKLTPAQECILATACDVPVTIRQLAKRTGYRPNSYFEEQVRFLVRAGLLKRTADGYHL